MFSFFRKNKTTFELPSYWSNYLEHFENKTTNDQLISETRFIILDVESTGLDPLKDKILSIGAVEVLNNQIYLSHTFELYLEQEEFNPKSAVIHGILKNGNVEKLNEEKAIEKLIDYIKGSIIVGHSIQFDISILNTTIKKYIDAKILNKSIDTIDLYKRLKGADFKSGSSVSLDGLASEFKISKSDRHNAAGDAYITALLFINIIARLKNRGVLSIGDLFKKRRLL